VPSSPTPPEFFIDRSLGDIVVPRQLREAGFTLHTMREVYGARGEDVEDVEWLRRCGEEGWVALTKDKRIRYRAAERDAVLAHGVRQFVITSGNLTGPQQAGRFVDNRQRIVAACAVAGPFIYVVHANRIEKLYPEGP
jgi:hypothetical protein